MRSPRVAMLLLLAVTVTACSGPPKSLFNAAGYYVRGDTVYYLDAFPGKAREIDADSETFEILDTTYAKDGSAVYLNGVVLAEADPASFELTGQDDFSRDKSHIFLRDRVLTEDVAHFEFVEGTLTKDSTHVYWYDGRVLSDDPAHFEIVSHVDSYLFAKDSRTVYVQGNPLADADPGTFEVLGGAYAQDADSLHYFTDVVPDADAKTFEVLAGSYARDKAQAYWMGKVIPDADPATFVVLNDRFECTADATHAYYRDIEIADPDPRTFEPDIQVTNCSETFIAVR